MGTQYRQSGGQLVPKADRQLNIVRSPVGLGNKIEYAGEGHQQFIVID
jgi:hypothetical protein